MGEVYGKVETYITTVDEKVTRRKTTVLNTGTAPQKTLMTILITATRALGKT